jgi:DNA-binding PadR family transcriptional regulator
MFEPLADTGHQGGPRRRHRLAPGRLHGRHLGRLRIPGTVPSRRSAVRRGDVRSAILALLAEQPMHGYQVIQELTERSGGMWRPSAGSVYPTLQQLEDEGLVRAEEREGRRVFTLTEAGREAATSVAARSTPWEREGADEAVDLRDLVYQVAAASMQVAEVGTSASIAQARGILTETRRKLYRLLAEDEPAADVSPETEPPSA